MKLLIYSAVIFLFSFSLVFAKLEQEEKSFLDKIDASGNISKERIILKKNELEKIQVPMGHKYRKRIFSYWTSDDKTVWILNSIGKYKPITAAFVVKDCKINSAHVLIYREQIGYEIKHNAFLTQFSQMKLNNKLRLTRNIDNISGATLSVNSMDRMARTALILDNISNDSKC
tara:strand:+ start:399 stop:917 length:519 start_codon:yes stop_codon:yes gene_type:complete